MQEYAIIFIIWGAMIASSFWEAYVEGKHAWDKGKLGWKLHFGKYVVLTAYHFWLFWVMYPLLLILPLVITGFSWSLLGILLSAYASGAILEDFFWFVVNPTFSMKNFNSKKVTWYPWIRIGRIQMPVGYFVGICVSLASWYFLWR